MYRLDYQNSPTLDAKCEPDPALKTKFPSSRSTATTLELFEDVEFKSVDHISARDSFKSTKLPSKILS
ncbi:hypothetical protein CDL12_23829 [Handroanthus impetiginosus]|uniref:Uncharacterized protein n=1 Tax=Handroanthus impetiginosus TaxID=429701 RepID=A0A2G9GED6_9LAMI|nr:hypothetical protein CDL12_23829 [Handroanthus impetiginosus]